MHPSPLKTAASFCREYERSRRPLNRSLVFRHTLTAKTGFGKPGLLISIALATAAGLSDLLKRET
jgi:hypothetical protein